jgi:hypothetical protein
MANQQALNVMQAELTAIRALVDGHVITIQQQATDLLAAQAQVTQANANAAAAQADAATAQAEAAAATAAAAAATAAAAVAAAAPGQGPPAPAPDPINAPGQHGEVIDMRSTSGMKENTRATAPLLTIFTGAVELLETFLNELYQRAILNQWITSIFQINRAGGAALDMLNDYAQITMEEIRAMAANYHSTYPIATRASQAAQQLQTMLQCSLSPDLLIRVIARKAEYTFTVGNHIYQDGVGMLKTVFNLVATDTRVTIAMFEENLSSASLKQKMEELEYDIIKFHLWVNEQANGLRRRGQPVRLMVAGLFESYKLVPDDAFTDYAKQEQNKWEDSDTPALTNEQVMTKAETKYHAIKQKGE